MEKDLLNATFFNAITGAEVQADSWIVFHYLFLRHMQLCSIFILMSVMAVVLCIFLSFHLYITSKNMTTNEVSVYIIASYLCFLGWSSTSNRIFLPVFQMEERSSMAQEGETKV